MKDRGNTGTPLVITGRQMVYAAVNGFHSETLAYEWDAPGVWPSARRLGGVSRARTASCCIVLSWAPLLLDYAAIGDHDTSTFDQWTLDGDYLFNNTESIKKLYVIQDSDDLFLASWGSARRASHWRRPACRSRSFSRAIFSGSSF